MKEGTHAVHDRARDLQAEARAGAGRRSRRAGVAEAGRGRLQAPAELVQRQAVSQATLDTSTATRDNAQANLQQAQVNTKIAAVNYGYTNVAAPFDGIVSAHLVSVGELVGASSPTQLATIVALDPIYVNFNVNEQDVLRIRDEARRRGHDARTISGSCRSRSACRPRAAFRTRASSTTSRRPLNQSTGTLAVRGVLPNSDRAAAAGLLRARPRARSTGDRTRCWCPTSRSAATRPAAMCWSSTARTSSSSARCGPGRWTASCA